MSQSAAHRFLEQVAGDDALKREWNTCETPAQVVAIARRLGHDLDETDLRRTLGELRRADTGPLGEEELERVAGGIEILSSTDLSFESSRTGAGFFEAWPCKWKGLSS